MTERYTAADFANARFAEHGNGQLATRDTCDPDYPWGTPYSELNDRDMARDGWVPVPTKPQATRSEIHEMANRLFRRWSSLGEFEGNLRGNLRKLGVELIEDPEPTNAEKIIELMGKAPASLNRRDLAKWLDKHGVTAPNVKGN